MERCRGPFYVAARQETRKAAQKRKMIASRGNTLLCLQIRYDSHLGVTPLDHARVHARLHHNHTAKLMLL